jgi:hypothetical protein
MYGTGVAASTHFVEFAEGYRINDEGRVQSCRTRARVGTNGRWKDMKPILGIRGYLGVNVCTGDGKPRRRPIHELVLETFVGPRPPDMQCRHLDGNRTNNRLSNLAWGTTQENADDRQRHGTTRRGSRQHLAKLTEEDVRRIRQMASKGRLSGQIAREFGIHASTVRKAVTGKCWGHVA